MAGSITSTSLASGAIVGVVPLTVNTAYTAARAVLIVCTTAGNVAMTMYDGSIVVIAVPVGTTRLDFSVTKINTSNTTAVATYYNLH